MSNVIVKTVGGATLWQSPSLGLKSVPWVQRARPTKGGLSRSRHVVPLSSSKVSSIMHIRRASKNKRLVLIYFYGWWPLQLCWSCDHHCHAAFGLNKTPLHAKDNLAGKRRQRRWDTQQQSCCGFLWFGFLRRTSCYRQSYTITKLCLHTIFPRR